MRGLAVGLLLALATAAFGRTLENGRLSSSREVFGARLRPLSRTSYGVLMPTTTRAPVTVRRTRAPTTSTTTPPPTTTSTTTTTPAPLLQPLAPVAEEPIPRRPSMRRRLKGKRGRKRPRISIRARRLQGQRYQELPVVNDYPSQEQNLGYPEISNQQEPMVLEQPTTPIPMEVISYEQIYQNERLSENININSEPNRKYPQEKIADEYNLPTTTIKYDQVEYDQVKMEEYSNPRKIEQYQALSEQEYIDNQREAIHHQKEALEYNAKVHNNNQDDSIKQMPLSDSISYEQQRESENIQPQYEISPLRPSQRNVLENENQEIIQLPHNIQSQLPYEEIRKEEMPYEQLHINSGRQMMPESIPVPEAHKSQIQIYTSPEPHMAPSRDQAYQKENPNDQINTTPEPYIRIHEYKHIQEEISTTPKPYIYPSHELLSATQKSSAMPQYEQEYQKESISRQMRPTIKPYKPARLINEESQSQNIGSYRKEPLYQEIHSTMKPYRPLRLVKDEGVRNSREYAQPEDQEEIRQPSTEAYNPPLVQADGQPQDYRDSKEEQRPYEQVYKPQEESEMLYTTPAPYEQKVADEQSYNYDYLMDRNEYAQIYRQLQPERQPKWNTYIVDRPQEQVSDNPEQSYEYSVPEHKADNINNDNNQNSLPQPQEYEYPASEGQNEDGNSAQKPEQDSIHSNGQEYSNLDAKDGKNMDEKAPESSLSYMYQNKYAVPEEKAEDQYAQEAPKQANDDKPQQQNDYESYESERAEMNGPNQPEYVPEDDVPYQGYDDEEDIVPEQLNANMPAFYNEYEHIYGKHYTQELSSQGSHVMEQPEYSINQDDMTYDIEYPNHEAYDIPSGQRQQGQYDIPSGQRQQGQYDIPSGQRQQGQYELPSEQGQERQYNNPSASRQEGPYDNPSAQGQGEQYEIPRAQGQEEQYENPSEQRQEGQYNMPSASRQEGQYDIPSAQGQEEQYEIPRAQGQEEQYEIPRASSQEGQYNMPSAQGQEGQYEIPRASSQEGQYNMPSAQGQEEQYEIPSASRQEGQYDLPRAQGQEEQYEIPSASRQDGQYDQMVPSHEPSIQDLHGLRAHSQ